MQKVTRKIALIVVLGAISSTFFAAGTAQADPSPCGNMGSDVEYVGPCSVKPSTLLEFTASSNVAEVAAWRANGFETGSGDMYLDHVTWNPSTQRYHLFFRLYYAQASEIIAYVFVGGWQGSATLVITGNTITDPYVDLVSTPINVKRLGGGKCQVTTAVTLFPIQDFSYQLNLKLKRLKPKKIMTPKKFRGVKRITKAAKGGQVSLNDQYIYRTVSQQLVLPKRRVQTLARGKHQLTVTQRITPQSGVPFNTSRKIRLKKTPCLSKKSVTL